MWICTHVYAYTTFCRMEADKVCKLVHEAMRRRKGEEDCRRAVGNSGQQWLAHYFRVHCVISKCLLNFWEEPIATLEWIFRMKTFLPLKFCSLLHKLSWTYFLLSFLMTSFMLPSLQVHLISESLSKKEGSSIHFFSKAQATVVSNYAWREYSFLISVEWEDNPPLPWMFRPVRLSPWAHLCKHLTHSLA